MRPARDQWVPGLNAGTTRTALLVGHIARQVGDLDAEGLEQSLGATEVLECEDLGRRHQCALTALLDRADERGKGDHGLARTDIALQQTLHRLRAIEVGLNRAEHVLLRGSEGEGQRRPKCCGQFARGTQRERASARIGVVAMLQKSELEQEQLLIGQALTRRLVGVKPARLMAGT